MILEKFGVGDENEGGVGGRRGAQRDLRQLREGGKGSPVRNVEIISCCGNNLSQVDVPGFLQCDHEKNTLVSWASGSCLCLPDS